MSPEAPRRTEAIPVPTAEENARLAKRWFEEVWNQHRQETINEFLLPGSVGHGHFNQW